ncbi:MAG: AbrB/MazE/SpoVT family DNA-binding domain-containing protein [Rubrobacteraceae bacterium]
MTTVGTKYQVVIEREARRKLGILPGWISIQTVVGDRLELRFLPPEHERSLAGSLNEYARGSVPEPGEETLAWESHVDEEWGSSALLLCRANGIEKLHAFDERFPSEGIELTRAG